MHARGRDNFMGLHFFTVGDDPNKYAAICNLQWTGSSCALRIGLFTEEDIFPSGLSGWRRWELIGTDLGLQEIKDQLLIKYSDDSGFLVQDNMPTELPCRFEGGLARITIRLSSPLPSPLELPKNLLSADNFAWKAGYFHVYVELDKTRKLAL